MDLEIKEYNDWVVISIENRIDSFNHQRITNEVSGVIEDGRKKLALNLERAQFLSLPTIKYFSKLAETLDKQGGYFALCAPSEKIKRQIAIFASLDGMNIYRSTEDLYNNRPEKN